jgi:small subunit ribosomal protein S15
MLSESEENQIIQEFRLHGKDTGSAEVQIGILTELIFQAQERFDRSNDRSDRLSLIRYVHRRRRLLVYLSVTDVNRFVSICWRIGVSHTLRV